MAKNISKYLFIDESGDPVFYGNRKKLLVGTSGFQPFLILGMIETPDRKKLRRSVIAFMKSIQEDTLYKSIPSIQNKKGWYVHARGDHPEIRAKFFELIRRLNGIKAHIVIARKDPVIFSSRHNNNPTTFYFDVLHHLLDGKLQDCSCCYYLFLSQRGTNSMPHFEQAVVKGLMNEPGWESSKKYKLEIVQGREMPECSIIDYLIWAVQRKLLSGEFRYFEAMRDKFGTITDLYSDRA